MCVGCNHNDVVGKPFASSYDGDLILVRSFFNFFMSQKIHVALHAWVFSVNSRNMPTTAIARQAYARQHRIQHHPHFCCPLSGLRTPDPASDGLAAAVEHILLLQCATVPAAEAFAHCSSEKLKIGKIVGFQLVYLFMPYGSACL